LAAEHAAGPLLLCFSARHSLVGLRPAGVELALRPYDAVPCEPTDGGTLSHGSDDAVVLLGAGERFALGMGEDAEEARWRAEAALRCDPWQIAEQRLAPYRRLPRLADAGRARLLSKCLSVMRVNAMAPEGAFAVRWSTPDRVPHRDCWLWDSVFHALAMNRVDPQAASEYLQAVFASQGDDGMIPHQCRPDGWRSGITQPPLLCWGAWQNYQITGEEKDLRRALYHGARYLDWDLQQRDRNGNGLLEWYIDDSPSCRSGESGLDNSQRFDEATVMDAVDFSVFAAEDMRHLALIADELDEPEQAAHWRERAARSRAAVHDQLWSETHGIYVDQHLDGRPSAVQAVTGFLPLLLADTPSERVDRLLQTLDDPARFAASAPIPSISLDRADHSTDMWRGASWINMNYFVIEGLRRHQRDERAAQLRDASIALVQRWYEELGCTFEFYDARDERPPSRCERKGPVPERYDCQAKISSIRDYHWTAALTFLLLLEDAD